MCRANKLNSLFVVALTLFAVATVPAFATDLNDTNIGNDSSINEPKSAGSSQSKAAAAAAGGGGAAAAADSSGCFASDTIVTLANRKRIPIGQIRVGDEVLTTDGSTVFTTQMMMMLDQNRFSQTMFHTIVTASGHNVSLTKLHLIPIIQNDNKINHIPAKQVKIGNVVYVMSDDQIISSPVTSVITEMKTGYYAPLTMSGTLFVNDIMASCYANVQSHDAAHFYMGPLRLYHRIAQSLFISEPFGHQNIDGMHLIPHMMYKFGEFFRPTTLRFS